MTHRSISQTALACVAVALVAAACTPVVATPITLDSSGDKLGGAAGGAGGSGGAGGAGGGTTGSGVIGVCGDGVPLHTMVMVASISGDMFGLTVDGTNVYWGSDMEVGKVAKSGGTPVTLAAANLSTAVAVDATNLYWSDSDGVFGVPIAGGPLVTFGSQYAYDVKVDSSYVYWTEAHAVMKAPIGGGTPSLVSTTPAPGGNLAVYGGDAYWNNQLGPIQVAPLSGGSPTTIIPAQNDKLGGIALSGSTMYWGAGHKGFAFGPADGSSVTFTGSMAMGVAVDDTNAYWLDPVGGSVCKMPLGGGPITTLATGPAPGSWNIALDDTSVYWGAVGSGGVSVVYKTLK